MEEYTLKEYIDDQVIRLEQLDDFEARGFKVRPN